MNYIYIHSLKNFNLLLKEIESLEVNNIYIGVDAETNSLDFISGTLRLVQLEINDNIYILNTETLDKKYLKYVIQILNDKGATFVGQNIKFDIKFFLQNTGENLLKVYDLMVAQSVLTGAKIQYASLDFLIGVHLGEHVRQEINKDLRDLFITSEIITNEMLLYSALDVKYLRKVMETQLEIAKELNLIDTINLEMRVIPATAKMEFDGVYLDRDEWSKLEERSKYEVVNSEKIIKDYIWENVKIEYNNAYEFVTSFDIRVNTQKLKKELESITDPKYIKSWWYDNFNVNSRLQMMASLKMLGTELPNFQAKTLESLVDTNTVVKHILNYKTWVKRSSTYGTSFLEHIHPITNRVHSEFNQNGTETGRYSSSAPNLQNVPKDHIDGHYLWRECFRPEDDYVYVISDYSQQEYRIVGEVTGEDKIINAYLNDIDLHANTASIIYNKNIDDITEDERYVGKTINFGLLYGQTKWGLARQLNISINAADKLIKKVLQGLPKFKLFVENVGKFVLENYYSRTMLGRIRFFDEQIVFTDHVEYDKYCSKLKREGFNHVIQGTAADMLKLAFAYVFERNKFGNKLKPVLLIHDEIVLEVHKDIQKEAKEFVEQCMEEAFRFFVKSLPITVEAKITDSWVK